MPVIGGSRSHDRLARPLNQCTLPDFKALDENTQFCRSPEHGKRRQKGSARTRKTYGRRPQRAQRLKARDEIGAARNRRITEREATRRAAREQEAAELAARQAAEAAAREAERKAREEAQARRSAEQTAREAAEIADREAMLAARRAGRKKKKRTGR